MKSRNGFSCFAGLQCNFNSGRDFLRQSASFHLSQFIPFGVEGSTTDSLFNEVEPSLEDVSLKENQPLCARSVACIVDRHLSSKEISGQGAVHGNVMTHGSTTSHKPTNPVTIVVGEDETEKDRPGQLIDSSGDLYLFRANDTLHGGKTYLVDLNLTSSEVVRITDWWDETGYR